MGEITKISWTDATWNPWQGCHKVSTGCKHCYMYREKIWHGQDPTTVIRSKSATFNAPLTWTRNNKVKHGSHIFVCSWSDFFIHEADPWREEAWEIMRSTSYIYQVCTKRPERIQDHLPKDWLTGYPTERIWLGVTTEDQEQANKRIPILLFIPAKTYWISAEPLLESIAFTKEALQKFDWMVVGGESGPNCRPMDSAWAENIRDQCKSTNVAFFFKQTGGLRHGSDLLNGQAYKEFLR